MQIRAATSLLALLYWHQSNNKQDLVRGGFISQANPEEAANSPNKTQLYEIMFMWAALHSTSAPIISSHFLLIPIYREQLILLTLKIIRQFLVFYTVFIFGVLQMATQFTKLFSFILASVHDPPPNLQHGKNFKQLSVCILKNLMKLFILHSQNTLNW